MASNLIDTTQALASNDATVTPSITDHTQISQEQAPHVAASKTLRTWKRLARDSSMETEISQGPTITKRYRDEDLEVLLELPTKSYRFRWKIVNKIKWWRLLSSPAKHNESLNMELSWA